MQAPAAWQCLHKAALPSTFHTTPFPTTTLQRRGNICECACKIWHAKRYRHTICFHVIGAAFRVKQFGSLVGRHSHLKRRNNEEKTYLLTCMCKRKKHIKIIMHVINERSFEGAKKIPSHGECVLLTRSQRVSSRHRNFQESAAAAGRLHLLPRTHYRSERCVKKVSLRMRVHYSDVRGKYIYIALYSH